MSKWYLSIVALLAVVAISLGVRAGPAADDESPSRGGQPFSTELTGAEEVNAQGRRITVIPMAQDRLI